MAARFTPKIRSFVANSILDSVRHQQLGEWEELTNFNEGYIIQNDNKKYVCKNSGISGTFAPVHTSGIVSDGGINWIFIDYVNIGNIFKKNLYIGIGNIEEWEDENNPDEPDITESKELETLQKIISLKKLTSNNIRLGCRYHKWTNGSIYSAYDNKKDPLATYGPRAYAYPFYVITDEDKIYKCLNNNNNAVSTTKPTNTAVQPFLSVDGYVWKFLGQIDISSILFKTDDFFPVTFKQVNDASSQYTTQQNALKQSISTFNILKSINTFPSDVDITVTGGSPVTPATAIITKNNDDTIRQVLVSPNNQGLGYDLSQRVIAKVQKQSAPGINGAVGTITVTGGVITGITVGASGENYTNGAILLIYDPEGPPTTEAVVNVVISGGSNSIQQFQIVSGGSGYSDSVEAYVFPEDSGAVAEAVFAPKEGHGHNLIMDVAANVLIVNQRLTDDDDYFLTGENNAFRQVVLITDVVDKTSLEPAHDNLYIGPSHPQYNSGSLNKIDNNKGYILYINNLKKVIRSEGQSEDVSIIVTF